VSASGLRSAEDIAEASVADLGLEPMTEDRVRVAITSVIERRDAEHAAALDAAKPSDLAGRIRALAQKTAGAWADADDGASDEVLHDLVERLVQAVAFARRGKPIAPLVEDMRSSAKAMDAHVVGPACLEILSRTADELEAIVREGEEA
jgi:hypothetical protein